MNEQVKRVAYAFPSSVFGGRTGAWIVIVLPESMTPPKKRHVKGKFPSHAEALAFADTLPEAYCRYSCIAI